MANNNGSTRVVVITGLSHLYPLSWETAQSFASDVSITHIALLGEAMDYLEMTQTQLAAQFPRVTILAQQVDITSSESMAAASRRVRSTLGVWDIFVHNGSAHASRCPDTAIRDADKDLWWSSFEWNVRSLHFVALYFFPHMTSDATFINIVRTDLNDGGIERDSAGNASGLAAAKVVEYLGEENEASGLKVLCIVALPEDTKVASFIAWCVGQRSSFVHAMHLDASTGSRGYEVIKGHLRRRDLHENGDSMYYAIHDPLIEDEVCRNSNAC